MITLTTVASLIPLAIGLGGSGSSTSEPRAIAVVGRLSFTLTLTIFFVPYVYLVTKGMKNNVNTQKFLNY